MTRKQFVVLGDLGSEPEVDIAALARDLPEDLSVISEVLDGDHYYALAKYEEIDELRAASDRFPANVHPEE